jgi:CheY-like chemotaxis protein
MSVVCLSSDLGTSSKLSGAATRCGLSMTTAMSAARLFDLVAAEPVTLVLIDLTTAGLDVTDVVTRLRAAEHPPGNIIAFGPHVHESALAAAQAAGCDHVLTRGQMHANADDLLARFGSPA